MFKKPPSLRSLAALVLVPLFILTALAFLGIHAQRSTAFTRARQEAEAVGASQARLLSQELKAAILEIPVFPDPPVPGERSPADSVLDSKDLTALITLRDDPGAGFSPAGLPRQALAALRINHLHPSAQSRALLIDRLTNSVSSVLTIPALKKNNLPVPPAWQIHLSDGAEPAWISPDRARFLPAGAFQNLPKSPPHATAVISESTTPPGDLLARTRIDFPTPLFLDWILTDPAAITASVRTQTRWTLGLLSASVLVSALGLAAIMHAVFRERRLNHLKSQFVANVSHELRAPIGTIRLMADALQKEKITDPQDFHHLIVSESTRLSHLIENVLDFARIEKGRRIYHFEESDLTKIVSATLHLFAAPAKESGHTFSADLAPVTADVDPSAIQQALINLIDNALKFSPPGTIISLSLAANETHWTLAVTDEGPGIPPGEEKAIFEQFHRLGDELRRETSGSGIGLSIVRHIIKAHQGTVVAHQKTFTLSAPLALPAAEDHASAH